MKNDISDSDILIDHICIARHILSQELLHPDGVEQQRRERIERFLTETEAMQAGAVMVKKKWSEHFVALRKSRGMEYASALARASGVSQPVISALCRGTRQPQDLTVATAIKLARGLGVSVDELLVGVSE